MTDIPHLVPGEINEAARVAFQYGACDGLAIAVHDRTGWPLVKVTDAWNVQPAGGEGSVEAYLPDGVSGRTQKERAEIGEAGDGSALHWFVLRPDGKLIDIEGAHDALGLIVAFDSMADDNEAALGTSSREAALEEYRSP